MREVKRVHENAGLAVRCLPCASPRVRTARRAWSGRRAVRRHISAEAS